MNQFTELYKTFSDSDLLKIIRSPDDYQADAVVAAEHEINERQLSDVTVEEANAEIDVELQEKLRQSEKRKAVENKVKGFAKSFTDTVNPLDQSIPTTAKQIKLIVIVFGFISVFRFIKGFDMLEFMFFADSAEWDFYMVLYFVPLLLLPTATTMFWFRKKAGWVLLTAFLIYSAIQSLGVAVQVMTFKPSGFSALDNLFPYVSVTTHLMTFGLFAGTIWLLQKAEIKEIFSIDSKAIFISIGASALLIASLFLPFLFY